MDAQEQFEQRQAEIQREQDRKLVQDFARKHSINSDVLEVAVDWLRQKRANSGAPVAFAFVPTPEAAETPPQPIAEMTAAQRELRQDIIDDYKRKNPTTILSDDAIATAASFNASERIAEMNARREASKRYDAEMLLRAFGLTDESKVSEFLRIVR